MMRYLSFHRFRLLWRLKNKFYILFYSKIYFQFFFPTKTLRKEPKQFEKFINDLKKQKKYIQKPKSTRNQKSFRVWILVLDNLKTQKHLSGTLLTTLKHLTPRSTFIFFNSPFLFVLSSIFFGIEILNF